ncbi:MAG TPA: S41 family peptidase [Gemmatimonadales bacterium]|nr:S41 family peptidase [Gemmatimonadales bacterium]
MKVKILWAGLALLLASPSSAQRLTSLDRERAHVMLDRIREELKKNYYDSTLRGVDLAARAAQLDARLDSAADMGDVLVTIASLPLALHDSHTAFLPPGYVLHVEYGWDMFIIGDSCYVGRVTPGSDAERQGVVAGDRVVSVNGYTPTRENLWQLLYLYHVLRPQTSLRVVLGESVGGFRQLDLASKATEGQRIVDLTASGDRGQYIRELEREYREYKPRFQELGDVEIWKLPTFSVRDRDIDEGLSRARKHRALILDLRGDPGGEEDELLRLIGGLTPTDDTVFTRRTRRERKPAVAKGLGAHAFGGQLVVLVDSRSASASELSARTVQLMHRGLVVGDRSEGAVMEGRFYQFFVGQDTRIYYGAEITSGDLIMPDGKRLEGAGVTPDSLILPTGPDLAAGRDPVLARALAMAGMPITPDSAGKLFPRPRD